MNEQRLIRVLAVDDEDALIETYQSALQKHGSRDRRRKPLQDLESKLFGLQKKPPTGFKIEFDYARQASIAAEKVRNALENGRPYAVCFMDVRMPPGKDGIQAAAEIRQIDAEVNIAIVTAFSDYDPLEISARVPPADKLLYLQKPFHPWEIQQIAYALGAKWHAEIDVRAHQEMLEKRIAERTAELEKSKRQLEKDIRRRKTAEEKIMKYQSRLRALAAELSTVEEAERRRLSESIHDNLGHLITALQMRMAALKKESPNEAYSMEIDKLLELSDKAMIAARNLTFELSPPPLYESNFLSAIEWLISLYRDRYAMRIELSVSGRICPVNSKAGFALYRATGELLLNVVKHSGVLEAEVILREQSGHIEVIVTDSGKGFDADFDSSSGSGFGLFSIRERIEHLGGLFLIESKLERGTKAVVRLPLAAAKDR